MEELTTNQRLLFTEIEHRPFMTLFPSRKKLIWFSYPLLKDETMIKGDKLFIEPILNQKGDVTKFKSFIASVSV